MKYLLCLVMLVSFCAVSYAEYVNGYYRKDGTYVNGYNRTKSNNTVRDNYSYEGNYNPYTSETGNNKYRNNKSSEYYDGWYR